MLLNLQKDRVCIRTFCWTNWAVFMHKFYCSAIGDNDKDMYESKYGDPKMKKKKKKRRTEGWGESNNATYNIRRTFPDRTIAIDLSQIRDKNVATRVTPGAVLFRTSLPLEVRCIWKDRS